LNHSSVITLKTEGCSGKPNCGSSIAARRHGRSSLIAVGGSLFLCWNEPPWRHHGTRRLHHTHNLRDSLSLIVGFAYACITQGRVQRPTYAWPPPTKLTNSVARLCTLRRWSGPGRIVVSFFLPCPRGDCTG
jgi:hypothetical protein